MKKIGAKLGDVTTLWHFLKEALKMRMTYLAEKTQADP